MSGFTTAKMVITHSKLPVSDAATCIYDFAATAENDTEAAFYTQCAARGGSDPSADDGALAVLLSATIDECHALAGTIYLDNSSAYERVRILREALESELRALRPAAVTTARAG